MFEDKYCVSIDTSYYGECSELIRKVLIENKNIKCALDFGAGDGRNAIFLAREGIDVHAIEPSINGCNRINLQAKNESLPITVYQGNHKSIPKKFFDIVIAATVIDHIEASATEDTIDKLKRCISENGFIFMSVFTIDDPGARSLSSAVNKSETISAVKKFFKRGELLSYFNDLEIINYSETFEIDKSHGSIHWHGIARILATKRVLGRNHESL